MGPRGVWTGVLAALVTSVTAAAAQTGTVSGTLVVNGKKVPVQQVFAVTYDTPSPGRLVTVMVSDKPVDPKTFQEYTRIGPGERLVAGMITGALVTMHAEDKLFSGFQFTFDQKQRLVFNEVLVGTRDDNFSLPDDSLVLEVKSVSPRLAGRIRTKDAVADLGSQKVGVDLTFDVPVSAIGK